MELVEINADRKPRLTGGRRGASTLLPGGTNVTNNLVPVPQLPASAGNLAVAFDKIKRHKKTGGTIIEQPDGSMYDLDNFNVGRRNPRQIRPPSGGKMSKLVPPHGHGANTQIGTNYKLSQFGGSMAQPIGNTAATLSPALSVGSVGAGRKPRKSKKSGAGWFDDIVNVVKHVGTDIGKPFEVVGANPFTFGYDLGHDVIGPALKRKIGMGREGKPKGKDLKKLIKFMADTKAKLHGMKSGAGFFDSAFKHIKDVGRQLLDKHGEAILNKGKDLLLAELGKRANDYIGAGVLHGGSFFNSIFDHLKTLLTHPVVKQLGEELLNKAVDIGKEALMKKLSGGRKQGAGWFDDIVNVVKKVGTDIGKPFEVVGANPFTFGYDLGHDVIGPALKKKLGRGIEDERKIGGAKKPSARGAIVSKIMKEKNLSLPMASKYVKEHGLY